MSNPYMVQIPFCNTGNKNAIQLTQQAGQDPEDATYQEGFPPVTMLNEDAGGLPPKGLDFNGIFYELSSPIAHYCRGDRIQFDAAYAAAIGGYAKGWVVASNDYQKDYISLVDNNLADPNGTNTTWTVYAGQGSVPTATSTTTGTVKLVNSLASAATDAALTAAQGKVLNDVLDIIAYSPIPYFGNSAPSGFLAMNGQAITSAQYPKLFDRYGSSLPDLRGCFIRGLGGNSDALGVVQGDAIQQIVGETGYFSRNDDTSLAGRGSGAMRVKSYGGQGFAGYTSSAGLMYGVDFDSSRSVRTADETRPRNIAFLYIVRAG